MSCVENERNDEMKVRFVKCMVGGMNGEIVEIINDIILNEKDFNFKVNMEMCGGGDEDYIFWVIREDSKYFNSNKMEYLEDCELDDYWDELMGLSERYFN